MHDAYAYVLGQYLGDGCLSEHRRAVYRLRVMCGDDWPLVTRRLQDAMSALLPANKIGHLQREGCVEVSMYSKRWIELLPQHGQGRKHLRPLELTRWQEHIVFGANTPEFVCGLLHSDGCRTINRVNVRGNSYEYPRYFFSNRSEDIHRMLTRALEALGVSATRSGWQQSIAKRSHVALLDSWGADKRWPWPTEAGLVPGAGIEPARP